MLFIFASFGVPAWSNILIAKSSGTEDSKSEDDKSDKNEKPKLSVTEHSINIGGKQIKYKATAGFIQLKDFSDKKKDKDKDENKDKKKDKHSPHKKKARVFFIAYTKSDGENVANRPVSFSFNGGPGSASIWLHMGALGPRRAVLSERGEALPPPYKLEDNVYSWLDKTDLVFIDPVSTGFSRSEPDESPKKFHGYHADIKSVGEFIRLYLTKNKRWSSPKFVVGESYGTTRAAGLSNYLQSRYGIYLNGIVLVSSVLNFATLDFAPNNDLPYLLFLPSYTATAWYHKKLPKKFQDMPLNMVLQRAEEFASDDYMLALFQGDKLSKEARKNVSDQLASLIGLPSDYIFKLKNRVPPNLFFTRLLMNENKRIGRYDSRITGLRYHPGTDWYEYDPSFETVSGTFSATFNDYVRRELDFESELPYETLANVRPWKYKRAKNRYLNVAEDLRKAMSRNPYLKVLVCSGYYDLATPYYGSDYTINQMFLDPSIRKNIRVNYYDAGHMMYANKPDLIKLKSDFETFIKEAILPESALVPTAKR